MSQPPALFQKLWSREQWSGLPVHRSLLSPLSLLERTLHVFPDKVGVVDGPRRFTYREMGERVYRLASALRRAGVRKGDRVAVLSPYKCPKMVAFGPLPKTSTGKTQKFKLREQEWAGHRSRIR